MDFKQIQTIIRDFEKSSITELEVEASDFKIRLSKLSKKVEVNETEVFEGSEKEIPETGLTEVRAPLVGTFYITDGQGEEFVRVGDQVQEGDTVCILEAMKIMNEITAPKSGVIHEIKIMNGDPVGFDQVLMTIK